MCEGPDIDPEFAGVEMSELEDSSRNSLPVDNAIEPCCSSVPRIFLLTP
jgi:hypothetical protein